MHVHMMLAHIIHILLAMQPNSQCSCVYSTFDIPFFGPAYIETYLDIEYNVWHHEMLLIDEFLPVLSFSAGFLYPPTSPHRLLLIPSIHHPSPHLHIRLALPSSYFYLSYIHLYFHLEERNPQQIYFIYT